TRAAALLTEAGYTKGSGGWASASGARLEFPFTTTSGSQNETELSIIAAGWREFGLAINESIFPVALAQDQEARSKFPSLMTVSMPLGEDTLALYTTPATPRAENRWIGFNRGGWSN